MSVKIVSKLDSIEYLTKKLKSLDSILLLTGLQARNKIFKNWDKGLGADNNRLAPLTNKYKEYKRTKTGKTIPDMLLNGDMRRSFLPAKEKKNVVKLAFAKSQSPKVNGLLKKRYNILKAGKRLVAYLNEFVYKQIFPKR